MSVTSRILIAALLFGACATTERESRAPTPTAQDEPHAAPAPSSAPAPETWEASLEEARFAEEELERVPFAELAPVAPEETIVAVRFDPGAAALDSESRETLDRMRESLPAGDGACYLELQGHTDASGHEAANVRLSRLRAEAVRAYLHREQGVPLDCMGVVPLGSSAPAADNRSPQGQDLNRRVVVVVVWPPP